MEYSYGEEPSAVDIDVLSPYFSLDIDVLSPYFSFWFRFIANWQRYGKLDGGCTKTCSKTYSSGSVDFRDVYVSLLLFQGSYVWIKFRDDVPKYVNGIVYKKTLQRTGKKSIGKKSIGEKSTPETYSKWEPRYTPLVDGKPTRHHINLGEYFSEEKANFVLEVAKCYYAIEDRTEVDFGDGFGVPLPPMSDEVRSNSELKKEWVRKTANQVLEEVERKALANEAKLNGIEAELRDICQSEELEHHPEKESLIGKIKLILSVGPTRIEGATENEHEERENWLLEHIRQYVEQLYWGGGGEQGRSR